MARNGKNRHYVLVNEKAAVHLQWEHCGQLLDVITSQHDAVIGKYESNLREMIGREDEEFEIAWQQHELAVQDMITDMISTAFWEGVNFALGMQVKGLMVEKNGRARPLFREV